MGFVIERGRSAYCRASTIGRPTLVSHLTARSLTQTWKTTSVDNPGDLGHCKEVTQNAAGSPHNRV